MQTFDYETAWIEAAWPIFKALPKEVHDLLGIVGVRCADLRQLGDCSMPWPDENQNADSLYAAFQAIDSDILALASAAIHDTGHWWPGSASKESTLPGRESGSHWKFAHYADQVLRERFGLAPRGDNGRSRGVTLAIHEGAIRVGYASEDMWTWTAVAPATAAGFDHAKTLAARLWRSFEALPRTAKHERDDAAYAELERIKAEVFASDVWSEDWRKLAETARYMVDDQELERRRLSRMPPPDFNRKIEALKAAHAKKIGEMNAELAGQLWLLERRHPIENVIYYSHRGIFSWGWRNPLNPESVSHVLEFISEFPYPYEIKRTDGPILSGGIG